MQRRLTFPLASRIFALVVLPVFIAVACGFWLLTLQLTESVKTGARETLAQLQNTHRRLWMEADIQQRSAVASIAENPSLKAGMILLRENGKTPETLETVSQQLSEIHMGLPYDLMAVLDAQNRPLAATRRNDAGSESSVVLGDDPIQPQGILEAGGKIYRAVTVPINLGDEHIGYLVTARHFDMEVPFGVAVLLHGKQVAFKSSNQRAVLRDEVALKLNDFGLAIEDAELHVAGEAWIASRMKIDGADSRYRLWVLQSVDATMARLTSGINRVFMLIGLGALLIATVLALFTSHSVASPLTQLVKRLRESQSTGVLRGGVELTSSTSEVNELAAAFNLAARSVADSQRRLDEAYLQFTRTMAQTLDARDHATAGHSSRVSAYATQIAKVLPMTDREREVVEVGAVLHDIGKIGIPDRVLQKDGRLTDEEFETIKEHPLMGRRILEGVSRFRDYLSIIELHHENHDGSGYPWGLSGENIPLGARIVHVVDAFDAMTSCRPYRNAMPTEQALAILKKYAGTQFDPAIVEVFLELVRNDPGMLPPVTVEPTSPLQLARAIQQEQQEVPVQELQH